MTPMVGCEVARPLLTEFVDGELAVPSQVVVEAHVRACRTCAAHLEDLQAIGSMLRTRAGLMEPRADLAAMLARASWRAQAEQAMEWPVRLRRTFDDRRVAWSLAGATCGLALCVLLTAGLVAGLEQQAADSLAAVMKVLASPGSDQNPMQLDARMLPPRLAIATMPDDAPELSSLPTDDVVYAVAGTVTRQGRLVDYAILHDDRPDLGHRRGAAAFGLTPAEVVQAVSRLRFAPAQSRGESVAVNMVWVVARTTVRGTATPAELAGPWLAGFGRRRS
ncbi:MAG: zf-HC2 domain-containing protein [Vicinamibacterales bacterium]